MIIKEAKAEIILDSREETTICFSVRTAKGKFKTSAPSGKSTGKYEARPWGGDGKGNILHDIDILNDFKILEIKNVEDIERMSRVYGKLIGANSRFIFEATLLKALAAERGEELWQLLSGKHIIKKMPLPAGNAIGGGLHSSYGMEIEEGPEFQEFLFISSPKTKSFKEAVKLNDEAYKMAGEELKKFDEEFDGKRNDEGAWKTSLKNEHVLKIMYIIAKRLGLRIGLDIAASSFYDGFYKYHNKTFNDLGQVKYIKRLIDEYEIFYAEDPIDEREFYWFGKLLDEVKSETPDDKAGNNLIVGDDLTATNYLRLKKAIRKKCINAIIIKPNQNGSIFETARVVELAKEHGLKIIVSHRSGETMDDTIADLAVAWRADFIKCGIYGRERRAKLKRLIEIEGSFQKVKKKKPRIKSKK